MNALTPDNEAPPASPFSGDSGAERGQFTEAFVDAPQIKDHLALLHSFAELKLSVEGMASDPTIPHLPTDKELRWSWFVGLAVERFEKWCKALKPSHSETGLASILPPLDVLMANLKVWHTYLLSPGWYAEDINRIDALKGLYEAGEALAVALVRRLAVDSETCSTLKPSEGRVENWVQTTSTPFDPFHSAAQVSAREIFCPKCMAVHHARSVAYMTEEGTGYLQSFFMECGKCTFEITRDTLALRKLASDLAKRVTGKNSSELLAGTVRTPTNLQDTVRGQIVKHAVLSSSSLRRPVTAGSDAAHVDFIMQQADYKLDVIRELLASKMKNHGGKLLFSVELVGAVLRQGLFVAKMYDLQWTRPGFFDSAQDQIVLQHIIVRYHGFLDLMSSAPGSFFVPTLPIDLAWHTHQLMASRVRDITTVKFVGRFIDHNDNVDESKLSVSFDLTRRAWKDRFGMQYTPCGCPLLGKTIGQRLAHLVGHGTNPTYLVPPEKLGLDGSRGLPLDPAFLVAVPLHTGCRSGCGSGCGCVSSLCFR
ncbi:hypothetical protein B0H14DRAFT_2375202 [Mycena olivaceomarginata]|nr:hypothetical protein B0H14DRAFT_2375202 [Mycena olivaceomarginata]